MGLRGKFEMLNEGSLATLGAGSKFEKYRPVELYHGANIVTIKPTLLFITLFLRKLIRLKVLLLFSKEAEHKIKCSKKCNKVLGSNVL